MRQDASSNFTEEPTNEINRVTLVEQRSAAFVAPRHEPVAIVLPGVPVGRVLAEDYIGTQGRPIMPCAIRSFTANSGRQKR